MTQVTTWLAAGVYVLLGRVLVAQRFRGRGAAFALLNLAAVYLFFFWGRDARFVPLFTMLFVGYVAMVSVQYVTLRLWSGATGLRPWLAFLTPIIFLVAIRYTPVVTIAAHVSAKAHEILLRNPQFTLAWVFVGMSYLAFRTSYLVLEVRNGVVPRPTYWQYIGFAFFAPTLSVGPISPYSLHRRALDEEVPPTIPVGRAMLRVLVGGVKFFYFGPLLNSGLSYSGLLLDGHPHLWIDLPIAAVAYYLFLYCNFSGFCDIAIGGAGLMGIQVAENFDSPLTSRNIKDFWNRWHITLSQYMRDVVFSPLSKHLVRTMGSSNSNHAIALTIFIVFLIVGVWHGVGWNYAAFGAMHGLGVAGNHYYTVALKKRLGKERFASYNRSRVVHAVAVVLTFTYVTASLFLFANDGAAMKNIFAMLRWH